MEKTIKVVFVLLFIIMFISISNVTFANEASNVNFVSVNQVVYAIGTVNIKDGYGLNSNKIGVLKKGESITRIAIGDNGFSKVRYNGKDAYVSTDYLTTSTPEQIKQQVEEGKVEENVSENNVETTKVVKSSNSLLQSLKILNVEGLNFNKSEKEYSISVEKEIQSLEIEAIPESDKATVRIEGNLDFEQGENIVEIVVTAEDGSRTTYIVKVNKNEDTENIESNIEVEENIDNFENDNEAASKNKAGYVFLGVAVVVVLLIVFSNKKHKKHTRNK